MTWTCMKCIDKYCKKCTLSTRYKTSIKCKICCHKFHSKCAGIKKENIGDMKNDWLCRDCNSSIFPFFSITNKKLNELQYYKCKASSFISTENFLSTCSVCDNKVNKNTGIPCGTCRSMLHMKCTKLKNTSDFLLCRKNWKCPTCFQTIFPFNSLEKSCLHDMAFNSNKPDCVPRFSSEKN